jgi:hypothetical protein
MALREGVLSRLRLHLRVRPQKLGSVLHGAKAQLISDLVWLGEKSVA